MAAGGRGLRAPCGRHEAPSWLEVDHLANAFRTVETDALQLGVCFGLTYGRNRCLPKAERVRRALAVARPALNHDH